MSAAANKSGGPRGYFHGRERVWLTQITQGEFHVSNDPNEVISTMLGSCVAACIRDPFAKVGGMNHFLLPEGNARDETEALRYGAFAMERLINALLARGGLRSRLEAKLFGGANVMASLNGVGSRNAAFAEEFLRTEGILYVGGDLGGTTPRKVRYWPVSGRARVLAMVTDAQRLVQDELCASRTDKSVGEADNDVELF